MTEIIHNFKSNGIVYMAIWYVHLMLKKQPNINSYAFQITCSYYYISILLYRTNLTKDYQINEIITIWSRNGQRFSIQNRSGNFQNPSGKQITILIHLEIKIKHIHGYLILYTSRLWQSVFINHYRPESLKAIRNSFSIYITNAIFLRLLNDAPVYLQTPIINS